MPKYRIHCSSTRSYHVDVEAPSREALDQYYDNTDGSEFTSCEDTDWELHEVERLPDDSATDVQVDVDGNMLQEPDVVSAVEE